MSNTHYDRSNTMWIQPAPGRLVRDPAFHDVLPEAGREVEPSEYWQRRLRDGDVIVLKRPAASTRARSRTTQAHPLKKPPRAPGGRFFLWRCISAPRTAAHSTHVP